MKYKSYSKSTVTKTMWNGINATQLDEEPRNKPNTYVANWFLAEVPKQFDTERKVFLANGSEGTVYPFKKKKRTLTPISYHTQKLILDGSYI